MDTLIVFGTAAVLLGMGYALLTVSTREGEVGVITVFGRFRRIVTPGLCFTWPWERRRALSLQNQSMDLEFAAITLDQANVYFRCMMLYRVADDAAQTVRNAAFAFASESEFKLSMQRMLEDETRTYVSTQKQAEMIGISQDVVRRIKANVEQRVRDWGYCIEDLRYHNIHFDDVVTKSMARVVAAINERDAAENEGQALLIRKTKEAEADGAFITIKAEAEKDAWKMRGQGMAQFRREVASGVHDAVEEFQNAGLDPNYLLFFMYTEAIKHVAENAKAGHTIFIDTNPSRPKDLMHELAAFYQGGQVAAQPVLVAGKA